MESFDKKIDKRLLSLGDDIKSGYEYINNKDVKDNLIEKLENQINSANPDLDLSVFEKELDDLRFQKYKAEIINENIEQASKLEATQGIMNLLK